MEIRKLALYYGICSEVIGIRECLHDWKEEDVINTDGEKTEIYAVFESTLNNMKVMAKMFRNMNTKTSMSCLKWFNPNPQDEDEQMDNEWVLESTDMLDLMDVMVCTPWTIKKREWSDYKKRLEYMEEMVELVA